MNEHLNNKNKGPLFTTDRTVLKRDGQILREDINLIEEFKLVINISNGKNFTINCLQTDITELIIGKVGISNNLRNKENIKVNDLDQFNNVSVEILDTKKEDLKTNKVFDRHYENYSLQYVFALAERFKQGMELHKLTYMTHSCLVMRDGNIIYTCEDINRYNVLYKAYGYMILNDIDPYDTYVYFSGRADLKVMEMVDKINVGVFITKSSVTSKAAVFARKNKITLLCSARPDEVSLYSGKLPEE